MNTLIHSRSHLSERAVDELATQLYESMEDRIIDVGNDHEASTTGSSTDRFIDEETFHSEGKIESSSVRFIDEQKHNGASASDSSSSGSE
jgi:hypothetical protein